LSIAQHCPPNFTGADIYALCADAWFHAAKRSVSSCTSLRPSYMSLLAVLCWTYTYYLKVETLEGDPSRNNDAIAEEVIVETNDFMTVIFKSFSSKHNKYHFGYI
jgi:peroxin-6